MVEAGYPRGVSITVAIVGLGTAGAAAAAFCAERGLRVVGLERGPLGDAGARWVNGVPEWAFEVAGLPLPEPPERRGGLGRVHLLAGWGPERVRLRGVLEVDMRHLVTRLQERALAHGATLHGGVRVLGRDGQRLETSDGVVEADVIVDAAGLTGPRLLGQPDVAPGDLCAAAQEVRVLADPEAARAFFASKGAGLDEVLIFSGVAGGYSILNVHTDGHHVSLLTGSIPADGHRSGRALLDGFCAANRSWIGAPVFGGQRAIPLRRPLPVIGHDGVALLGDSACQVYAAHGSGVAQQLAAARVLSDALATGQGVNGYNVAWQRGYGGVLAGSDLFRRFSQRIPLGDLRALMARGVLTEPMMRDALLQRSPRPPLRDVARSVRAMGGLPRLSGGLVATLARMGAVQAHYRRYPSHPAHLSGWVRRLEQLSGVAEPRWGPVR